MECLYIRDGYHESITCCDKLMDEKEPGLKLNWTPNFDN